MRYILLVVAIVLVACNTIAGTTSLSIPTATYVQPSPSARFNSEIGTGASALITLEQIGSIPANTRVRISSATLQGDEWIYSISDTNGNYEEARESQLAFAPDTTPGAPTPTAMFGSEIGTGTSAAITLEQIGSIPAHTEVWISTAMFQDEWIYTVADANGNYEEARESQLGFAPDYTPGAPIPTAMFQGEIGMGRFPAITLEQIGNIPANTRVSVSTAMWLDEWIYSVYDENGNYADARESQLAFAPDVTPGAPTPTGD